MEKAELVRLAKAVAESFGLEPTLVCAICEQESSWNPSATRYESLFREHYINKLGLPDDEATQRSTSWGLMQLMGQVARELGFSGDLSALLDPEIGLPWSCRYLETRLKVAEDNTEKALLLWNGGGNKEYPDQVFARLSHYEDSEAT